MRLWTVQPEEVYKQLLQNGSLKAEVSKSECLEGGNCKCFVDAYKWLIEQMEKRGYNKPKGYEIPWWAWYRLNGKNEITSEIETLCTPRKKFKLLELEVPDKYVLLSDYDAWHYVLNKWWYDDSTCDEEWEKNRDWFDALPYSEQERLEKESWQKIFDIRIRESEWNSNGLYVQAVFWVLKADYIVRVTDIVGRSDE